MRKQVADVCVCPVCRSHLEHSSEAYACVGCEAKYAVEAGVPLLVPHGTELPAPSDEWYPGAMRMAPAGLRPFLEKHRHRLRPILTYEPHRRSLVADFVLSFGTEATVLNIGSGTTSFGGNVVNLDIVPAPGVDVVAVAESLPIRDESCDGAILLSVLEHVTDAQRTLEEIRRVLKPGGRLLIDVPFMQGYHPAPGDFRRYTEQGLRAEIGRYGFEVESSGVSVGPASAAAWTMSEFLAVAFSFRSATAYRLARLVTTWVALPLKYLDRWYHRHPMAYMIPSAIWVIARATESSRPAPSG